METLLSPAESIAFSSFLSSMENNQPQQDWPSYPGQLNSAENPRIRDDEHLMQSLPSPQENDPLTKATMDLMSLDSGSWIENGMGALAQQQQQHQHQHQMHHQQSSQVYDLNGNRNAQVHPMSQNPVQLPSFSSLHDPFPFLNSKAQQPVPFGRQQHPQSFHPQSQTQFIHQGQHSQPLHLQQSPNDLYTFPQSQSHPAHQPVPHPHAPAPKPTSPTLASGSSKRPLRPSSIATASSSSSGGNASAPAANTTGKRASTSYARNSIPRSPHPNGTTQASKPALLSPSQKKANHIQSEQKRRANIRRGYEALCEIVPALREAIREEEEEARATAAAAGVSNGKTKATNKKRSAKKKDGEEGARDKIDGRAGPRSENVVLSKTIEYINDLLADQSALLARLHRARSHLPPSHPLQMPSCPNPPWEREWKGGEGRMGDNDGEDGEDSDEMDENEDGVTSTHKGESSSRRSGKDADETSAT